MNRLVNALKVKCDVHCDWKGELGDLAKHKNKDCPEFRIHCDYASFGCNVKLKRALMADHLKIAQVMHFKMEVQFYTIV